MGKQRCVHGHVNVARIGERFGNLTEHGDDDNRK